MGDFDTVFGFTPPGTFGTIADGVLQCILPPGGYFVNPPYPPILI